MALHAGRAPILAASAAASVRPAAHHTSRAISGRSEHKAASQDDYSCGFRTIGLANQQRCKRLPFRLDRSDLSGGLEQSPSPQSQDANPEATL